MGESIGSYVMSDEDGNVSRQMAIPQPKVVVPIMDMEALEQSGSSAYRFQAIEALGKHTKQSSVDFEVEEMDLDDIGVEPMSLFSPRSSDKDGEDKLYSIQLYSARSIFERKDEPVIQLHEVRQEKKGGIKNSILQLLWKRKDDDTGKTNKWLHT